MPRVLIIDDDTGITQLLEEHLSNEGYEVTSVHRADEGLETVIHTPPDLILLDVMLPDATGFQTLGKLRQNKSTQTIPIIIMSGSARNANQQEIGKKMGATDYILKPFDIIQVGDKIHELLNSKFPQTSSARAPASAPVSIPVPASAPEPAVIPVPKPLEEKPKIELMPMIPEEDPAPAEFALPEEEPSYEAVKELPMPSPKTFQLPNFDAEPPPPVSVPVPAPAPSPMAPLFENKLWILAAALLAIHVGLAVCGAMQASLPQTGPFHAASFIAGGWVLMLGLLVLTASLFKIRLEARQAINILGWTAIPIVLRAALALVVLPMTAGIPDSIFWMRPLDIFELASAIIAGFLLSRQEGSSAKKSILAALFLALAWSLATRGYFRP